MDAVTQDALTHLAALTFLAVGFFFLVVLWPKKLEKPVDQAKVDYHVIKYMISECHTLRQVRKMEQAIDEFFTRHHRSDKDNKDLIMYYTFLLRAISEKKSQINAIEEITA
jgi:hypothetical protein